jgi:hypothetical protein
MRMLLTNKNNLINDNYPKNERRKRNSSIQ